MADREASGPMVPITFKLLPSKKKLMEAICSERAHENASVTYREAVDLYIAEYHRSKAA